MLNFERRKTAFADLGHFIGQLIDKHSLTPSKNDSGFTQILNLAKAENQWFTEENVCYALREWSKALHRIRALQSIASGSSRATRKRRSWKDRQNCPPSSA